MDSYTKVLLHLNGTDASTTFTDESGKTWTAHGNAKLDTAQKKFGTASLLLDGTGDYISTPDHDDFNFGSGDFTIDFWVRFNTVPGVGSYAVLYDHRLDADSNIEFFYSQPNGGLVVTSRSAGVGILTLIKAWSPSPNTWYHIALVRYGNIWRIFVDGTQIGADETISITLPNVATILRIGIQTGDTYPLNGWLDEFRISKGIARWTSNFTPYSVEYTTTSTSTSTSTSSSSTSTSTTSSSSTSTSTSTSTSSSSTSTSTSTSTSSSRSSTSSTSTTTPTPPAFAEAYRYYSGEVVSVPLWGDVEVE